MREEKEERRERQKDERREEALGQGASRTLWVSLVLTALWLNTNRHLLLINVPSPPPWCLLSLIPLLTGATGLPFDFAPHMAAAGWYLINRDTFIDRDPKYKFRHPKHMFRHPKYKFIHPKYKSIVPEHKFRHPKYSGISSDTQSISSDTKSTAI